MDTSQWPQEINLVRSVEEIIPANKASGGASARPEKEKALLNCPRCQSTNTKFCYYNNYSLSQPRYFCKTCRRYWTQGGSLRNIPMGGGSRKNRRPTAMASSSSKKQLSSGMTPPSTYSSNTQLERRHDLNLAFPEINTHQADDFRTMSEFVQIPINGAAIENNIKYKQYHQMTSRPSSSLFPTSNRSCFPADPEGPELFSGLNYSLMPILPPPVSDPNTSSGLTFSFPEYKPSFCFSLDHGVGSSGSGVHGKSSGSASSSFRFEDLKHISSATNVDDDPNKAGGDHSSSSTAGYWTGMLGGGSW